jgi:DNA-binding Lrp family transcriptional regulator
MTALDARDRALLEAMQASFPLDPRPYRELGTTTGLPEEEVIARVRRLKEDGIIRQIGAIFDTRRLGYQSTLVAFHVPGAAHQPAGSGPLAVAAGHVSAHPGVSHNYARPHHYNLWFTLAVPPGRPVEAEIERLAGQAGVDDWLNLPALRVFKLRTHFRLGGESERRSPTALRGARSEARPLARDDVAYVRALQLDLPVVSRPFAETAGRFGLDQGALLDRAREFEATGIMRRFSAVVRHRRVGYTANGMACWVVPASQIEAAGRLAARYPQVSHCYERPAYPPHWPYTLFTMIHGQTEAGVEAIVAEIADETGIETYTVLYSTHEFKKERVRYFEEEET